MNTFLLKHPMSQSTERQMQVQARIEAMNRMIARASRAEYVAHVSYENVPHSKDLVHQGIRTSDNREIGYTDEQMDYFGTLMDYHEGLTSICPDMPTIKDLGLPNLPESIALRLRVHTNPAKQKPGFKSRKFI